MENEEDNLSKKFAEGGMTVTQPTAQDQDEAAKIIAAYWDEWAKTRGPDAAAARQAGSRGARTLTMSDHRRRFP